MTAEPRGVEEIETSVLMANFTPGSGPWSWDAEFDDIRRRDDLTALAADVAMNGIREPLLLGDDGRVWDGHHRLAVAVEIGLPRVPVEFGRSGPVDCWPGVDR